MYYWALLWAKVFILQHHNVLAILRLPIQLILHNVNTNMFQRRNWIFCKFWMSDSEGGAELGQGWHAKRAGISSMFYLIHNDLVTRPLPFSDDVVFHCCVILHGTTPPFIVLHYWYPISDFRFLTYTARNPECLQLSCVLQTLLAFKDDWLRFDDIKITNFGIEL